jgi:hypothetical protein
VGDPCESGNVIKGYGVLAGIGAGGHSEGFRAGVRERRTTEVPNKIQS